MERSFVLVLTVVTLVTATPHGYGVKGGASAKAEASAVAGAFGDLGPIPLSIPSGAAYSGSFSKSSSSSFASSSASSSSSSYSFSGSSANGISGIGTNKGCSSGTCPGAGAGGSSLNGPHDMSGANAVSAAQAKAISGAYAPCQGSNCKATEKCTTGKCSLDTALKGSNECSTGNCNPTSPSSQIESGFGDSSNKEGNDKQEGNIDDSNDFAVNLNRKPQPKSSENVNGQYSNKGNAYDSLSDCSNGKCSPGNTYQGNLGNSQSRQPAPATYLTTPNENPPCTSSDCNYPSQNSNPQTGGLPSSYNVPLQSATNPPNTYSSPTGSDKQATYPNAGSGYGGPCRSPNCNSAPSLVGTPNIPNNYYDQQDSTNQGPCAAGQCSSPSSPNGKTSYNAGTSGIKPPNFSHGSVPSNVPSGQSGCSTPNCAGLPTYSNLPTYQSGSNCNGAACSGASLTGSPIKPSDSNTPIYSGGFGGPGGFLDKTSGNSGYDHGNGSPNFASTPIQGSFGTNKPHQTIPPSNYGSPHTPTSNIAPGSVGSIPVHGSFETNKPNVLNPNYGSTQTSSNGDSLGVFGHSKPSTQALTPSSQLKPSHTGTYGPTIASSAVPLGTSNIGGHPTYSGNSEGSADSSLTNSGSNSIHGTFGIAKPSTPTNLQSSSGYTGTFGGTTSGPSSTFGSTGLLSGPATGNCGLGNCNSQTSSSAGGTNSYDKTNNPSVSTSSQKKPAYNGGFGGPTGLLKPNDFNVPSNAPTAALGNTHCSNGNCGSQGNPSASHGSSLPSTHQSGAASAIASANAVAYSGGFGGPPGLLKPYDDGKANIPVHGNLPSGYSPTSNFGNLNTPSANGKDLGSGSSTAGANAGAQASATASASAGSYSGGNNNQNNNGASRGCNSGCNSNEGAGHFGFPDGLNKHATGAGSVATAKSSAGANAYGVGGSFASSSASAHASAGAATKGGYGRK